MKQLISYFWYYVGSLASKLITHKTEEPSLRMDVYQHAMRKSYALDDGRIWGKNRGDNND